MFWLYGWHAGQDNNLVLLVEEEIEQAVEGNSSTPFATPTLLDLIQLVSWCISNSFPLVEGPERSTKAIFRLQAQKNKCRIDIVVAKSVTSQMEFLKAEKYSYLKQKETRYWGFFGWAMTIRRKRIVSDFTAWVEDTEEAGRQMLNVFSGIIFWQQQYWLCLFLEAVVCNVTWCSEA